MYRWDFSWVWLYRGQLLEALGVTILLNAAVVVIGTVVGLADEVSDRRADFGSFGLLSALTSIFFGRFPLLRDAGVVFLCGPILLGIRLSAFASAVIVLGLNLSAFVAEIVRAGIQAVPQSTHR